MELSRVRLAADVGGTFTDVAAFDETTGELRLGKTLTTPARLVTGVENGVTKAGAQRRVDLRPVRPRTCDRLIADSDQLDVPGIKAPCGVVRAELRMLSSWLHGKSEDLIVPDPARGRCLPDTRPSGRGHSCHVRGYFCGRAPPGGVGTAGHHSHCLSPGLHVSRGIAVPSSVPGPVCVLSLLAACAAGAPGPEPPLAAAGLSGRCQ